MDAMMVWLPLHSLEELIGVKDSYSQISVRLRGDRSAASSFMAKQSFHGWTGSTATEEVAEQLRLNRFRKKAISFVSGLLLLIAIIGLNNTMMMRCFQRKKELGVLRAIGLSPKQIILLFQLEGILVGFLSGLVASLLGGGGSYYFSREGFDLTSLSSSAGTANIPPILYTHFSPSLLVFVWIVTTLLCGLASILPIILLLRQPPHQLLMSE